MKSASYRISHTTTYSYQSPVRICHNLVMLSPRADARVSSANHRVVIRPTPTIIHRREDYFGNQVHAFSIEEDHRQLVVSAQGSVRVNCPTYKEVSSSPAWETVRETVLQQSDPRWLEVCQFRFDSNRIQAQQQFEDFATQSFVPATSILNAVTDLNHRIFSEFSYDSQATHVHTPVTEAFEMRKGVCQDFAHVMIACLRSIGLSARYVSGYLKTVPAPGEKKLIGADQSHAWVSVYCGQKLGWIDFDPTNDKLSDTDHIPIAWGRDYDDVVPIRGVFLGGGKHQISVSVDVSKDDVAREAVLKKL